MDFTIDSIIGIRLHMYSWTVLVLFDPSSRRGPITRLDPESEVAVINRGDCIGG
jgi:hypothetical protein